jgi:hypothetical protein
MSQPSESKQPTIIAITILFPAISTIVLSLRLWQRFLIKQFHWGKSNPMPYSCYGTSNSHINSDDGLVCVALALAIAQAGAFIKFVQLTQQGHHIWDIATPTINEKVEADKWSMAQQLLYNPILCLVKASILVFLIRLGDKRKFIQWSSHVLFWFNLGHMISVFFAALTQCLPIHMYWDHYHTDKIINGETINPNYSCFDMAAFSLITAGLAILTDVLIILVPVAMIWNLRMPVRQKIAVGAALSLGWIVAVLGIIRFKIFYSFWFPSEDPGDSTYSLSITLSGIEVNVAIITACVPSLKALKTRFVPRFFSSKDNSRPTGNLYYSSHGYELNSGTRKKNDTRLTAHKSTDIASTIDRHDGDGDSQEHIVRNSSLHTDEKSENVALEEEINVLPPGRTVLHNHER